MSENKERRTAWVASRTTRMEGLRCLSGSVRAGESRDDAGLDRTLLIVARATRGAALFSKAGLNCRSSAILAKWVRTLGVCKKAHSASFVLVGCLLLFRHCASYS